MEPTESGFVEAQDRISRLEEELQRLREQRDAHIAAIASIRGNLRSEVIRIRDTLDKVLNTDRTLGERLRTIFTELVITIASLVAAIGAILAAVITALTGGGAAPMATGGGPTEPTPAGARARQRPAGEVRQCHENAGHEGSFIALGDHRRHCDLAAAACGRRRVVAGPEPVGTGARIDCDCGGGASIQTTHGRRKIGA
jgi:hypothetical protein